MHAPCEYLQVWRDLLEVICCVIFWRARNSSYQCIVILSFLCQGFGCCHLEWSRGQDILPLVLWQKLWYKRLWLCLWWLWFEYSWCRCAVSSIFCLVYFYCVDSLITLMNHFCIWHVVHKTAVGARLVGSYFKRWFSWNVIFAVLYILVCRSQRNTCCNDLSRVEVSSYRRMELLLRIGHLNLIF